MDDAFRVAYSDGSIGRIRAETSEIWRYMDLGKLVSMLQHRALYFPVIASFPDALEAARPKLPGGTAAIDQHIAWRSWNMWRCITFASCWHLASVESAALWEIYAGRNQGIAIKSSIDALSSAFPVAGKDDSGQLVKAGIVEYIDPDLEEPLPSQLGPDKEVLRKRNWYAYEKELRVYYTLSENWIEPSNDFEPGRYKMPGIWLYCDLSRLIGSVMVSPSAPSYMESAIREVLKRFDFDPELVQPSRLSELVTMPNPTLVREEWIDRFQPGIEDTDDTG